MSDEKNKFTSLPENFMEDYQWIDEYLQEQPSTQKVFQPAWQAFKYLVKDKMYAYIGIQEQNKRPIITLKLEPVFSDVVRKDYVDIVPGYYMNKTHWSTIYLDSDISPE